MNNGTEQIFLVNSSESQPVIGDNKVTELPSTSQVNLENVEDFSNVCRTCATITEFVMPIFIGEGLQNNLADKIHKHLPIQVTEHDLLPRVVCYQCASTLLAWHELVQCCVQADKALKTRLAVKLPKENNTNKQTTHHEEKSLDSDTKVKSKCVPIIKDILAKHFRLSDEDYKGSSLEFVCKKCKSQSKFLTLQTFVEHLQSKHNSILKDVKSTEAFLKEYVSIVEILVADDQTTVSETEKERNGKEKETVVAKLSRYHCPFCESSFSSISRLTCHLNKHVDISIKDGVQCCDIVYNDNKHFALHLQEKHVKRSTNDSYVCQSCGYLALDSNDLQSHVSGQHNVGTNERDTKVTVENRDKYLKYTPAVCPKCKKTFSNKYNMFVHMKSHANSSERYPCDRCNKSYKSQASLTHHQKVTHEGILSFVCSHCGEAFPSRTARDVHNRIHTGDRPYSCQYCSKSYRAKNTLDRHMEMHLDIRKYQCHLCPKKFRKRTHLNYHVNAHERWTHETYSTDIETDTIYDTSSAADVGVYDDESADDEPLAAVAAKKSKELYNNFYRALVNFGNHYISEHGPGKSDVPVFTDSSDSEEMDVEVEGEIGSTDVDDYDDLTSKNMRKDHMNEETRIELNAAQHKIDGKVYYVCSICDKRLSSPHTYIFHKRIHTGERPCVCHVCGKQFRAPHGLQRHLTETHERIKRHPCGFCSKTFANTQNLKQHVRIHTGERPYVCPRCGKRFTQSGSLHVHLRTHSEQFPFQCVECGAKFRLRLSLTRHRLKHTGEKPHSCLQCGKNFRQRRDLYSHMICHGESKPHTCVICSAAFKQSRALKHHCKRVHQSETSSEVNALVFDVAQYQ